MTKASITRKPILGPAADLVTEAEALAEMLADLEDACDPDGADLYEELASRLRLVCGSC